MLRRRCLQPILPVGQRRQNHHEIAMRDNLRVSDAERRHCFAALVPVQHPLDGHAQRKLASPEDIIGRGEIGKAKRCDPADDDQILAIVFNDRRFFSIFGPHSRGCNHRRVYGDD